MENQLAVYEERPLTALQLREQVNLIQDVMKQVMQEGQHYGVIPGCGDKPSLLKPGAEKLMFTFRLVADPEVEVFELYHPTIQGHREYRVKVRINSMNGNYMGGGIGSCSTMESKYRFRGGEKTGTGKPIPKEYWNLRKEGKNTEAQELIGGHGFSHGKVNGAWEICEIGEKAEHDNPADFYNTCEKMAKKRALVDATLTVTAASDIFTQDIEEMVENGVIAPDKPKAAAKPQVKEPQKKAAATAAQAEQVATVKVLSVASKDGVDSKKKPYTIFTIFDEEDVKYGTFSETFADLARSAKESGELVKIAFTVGQYGNKIVNLELAEAAQ